MNAQSQVVRQFPPSDCAITHHRKNKTKQTNDTLPKQPPTQATTSSTATESRESLKAEFEALQQHKADLQNQLDALQQQKEDASAKLDQVRRAKRELGAGTGPGAAGAGDLPPPAPLMAPLGGTGGLQAGQSELANEVFNSVPRI